MSADGEGRPVPIVAPTTRENVHVRAMRTLVEGRVGIERVAPGLVEAWVRCLSGHVHRVSWDSDRDWNCQGRESGPSSRCYHVEAVLRVVVLPDNVERAPWPTTEPGR